MKHNKVKLLMVGSALALTLLASPDPANSQVTISADFATAPALVIAAGNDIDFGTWVVSVAGTETPTIRIPPVLAAAAPTAATGSITSSVLIESVASTNSGSVTVQTPTGVDNQQISIAGTITDNFDNTDIVLSALTFVTATETVAVAVPAALDTTPEVTVLTGGTPEEVAIGGLITIGDAIPAGTAFGGNTDVVITINFAY